MSMGYYPYGSRSVSIITCTKRAECMPNLFANYGRQLYKHKELIVILNRDDLSSDNYRNAALSFENVRILRVPEQVTLGSCLNIGVQAARYPVIAKFDDDDYYAPNYLAESIQTLLKTEADIVGKRSHFMCLSGRKGLLLHRYFNRANQYVPLVQGATLLVRRHVFRQVEFPDISLGECVKFCSDCLAKGFKIYAGSPYNFLAIRRRNSKGHTWIVSDRTLTSRNVKVLKARDARSFVERS